MLKLHQFDCPACGHAQDELLDIPPNMASVHCKRCRASAQHAVLGGKAHVFKPFWHEHLDHRPVYIKSWSHYREELKKRNYANKLAT